MQGLAEDEVSNNQGLSHFLRNATIDFLHDDRDQHCAISGLSVRFQKNNPGIRRGLSVKNRVF